MHASHLDALARSLAHAGGSRRSIVVGLVGFLTATSGWFDADANKKKNKKKTICNCADGSVASCSTLKLKKKAAKKRLKQNRCAYAGACAGRSNCCTSDAQCGAGCCGSSSSCFAETVSDADRRPLSFGCCPAQLTCVSSTPEYPDQCCYPDEYCDPTLPARFPTEENKAQTICCRPCGGGCCIKVNEECINGVCTGVNTARLPRARRP